MLYSGCWGIGDTILTSQERKLCPVRHPMCSPGPKDSSTMNSLPTGNQHSVSVQETSQRGNAGWPSTALLRLWDKQDGSQSSKKPARAGRATGTPIARKTGTPASTISGLRQGDVRAFRGGGEGAHERACLFSSDRNRARRK